MRIPNRRRYATSVFLTSVILFVTACVDFPTADHETCISRGFDKSTSEYDYCRDKLRELHNEEEERRRRFFDMMIE